MPLPVLHHWRASDLGLPAHATLRCLLDLGTRGMALGSDYGLLIWRDGAFHSFPFPAGARREMRHVEAMTLHQGELHVATMKGQLRWGFQGVARGKGLPRDEQGVVDDLRTLLSRPQGMLRAWRTHLEGGVGPADTISLAQAPDGRCFAGSMNGQLQQVDGPLLRRFEQNGRPAPVRYLAWAHGELWVAAAGALHRWDGHRWDQRPGESAFLHRDHEGRLWEISRGDLSPSVGGEWPRPLSQRLGRPWTLASQPGRLWVGERGGLWVLDSSR